MQIEITQYQGGGFNQVATVHNGQRLTWSCNTFGKVRIADPDGVFREINRYFATLSADNADALWGLYEQAHTQMEEVVDTFKGVIGLKYIVHQMYQLIDIEEASKSLLKGDLFIPPEVNRSLTDASRYKNRDQTYLVEDYINLAVFSMALRALIPLWGEYIDQGGHGTGNDLYKEMEAMSLINDASLIQWPSENPAFEKLASYIMVSSEANPATLSSIWRGMGNEEVPTWLLANVLVRRLTIVPLEGIHATNICAYVYRYIRSKLKASDRRTSDRVTEKRHDGGGGRDEDDKTSLLEEYKIKQRIADGDTVLFSEYTRNMMGIAQEVDPTIRLNLLDKAAEALPRMEKTAVNPHQVKLAQWVLAKGFPPRAMGHITKEAVNRLLVTAQALMWHWGFLEVACLMTVDGVSATDQNVPGLTHRPRPSTRISRKYIDQLMELYPHVKAQRGKDTNLRNGNVAAIGINTITRDIMAGNWYYLGTLDLKKLAENQHYSGRGILVVPPTIKNTLTELVIYTAQFNQ